MPFNSKYLYNFVPAQRNCPLHIAQEHIPETVFPYLRQHPWNFHITDVHSMYIPGDISVSYLFLPDQYPHFDHIHSGRITFHYFCIFSTAFITGCILKKSDSCIFIF